MAIFRKFLLFEKSCKLCAKNQLILQKRLTIHKMFWKWDPLRIFSRRGVGYHSSTICPLKCFYILYYWYIQILDDLLLFFLLFSGLPKFFLYGDNVSFSYKSNKRSGFTLALNEVKISTYYENKDQIQVFLFLNKICLISFKITKQT